MIICSEKKAVAGAVCLSDVLAAYISFSFDILGRIRTVLRDLWDVK